MNKANAIGDITKPGYIGVDNIQIDTNVDDVGTIDNHGLEKTKSKVDIVLKKKQIVNANSKIYYAPK